VFVFPADHQRTRLTHALEVAQVATAVARAVGLNVALVEAIALGHDCGHGPGGHACEDAFSPLLPEGFDHAPFGSDVILAPLNLCSETLDGIRNHSWSRPTPSTPEGAVVAWADRCAYSAHDLEDAQRAGIVHTEELPPVVKEVAGTSRSAQLRTFITALVTTIRETGTVGMDSETASALGALRSFNYERIYTRPESIAQGDAVISVLRSLVCWLSEHPEHLPEPADAEELARRYEDGEVGLRRAAVAWVAGMTDRYAFRTAVDLLGWEPGRLPAGIDLARAQGA
jgi:dGTPase